MKSKLSAQKLFEMISFLLLIATFVGAICFFNIKIDYLINSDAASELILGKLLASENRILSENWFYSTELRVLNTQIFYSLFFKLTNDWHLVRIAAYASMYAVMLFLYGVLCRALKCRRSYYALTAALLLLPFSNEYFLIVLQGAYYIPHISITFITLAFVEFYIKEKGNKAKILFIMAVVLSIIAGMGGPRQVIVLYLPLAFSAFVIVLIKWKDHVAVGEGGFNLKKIDIGIQKYVLFSRTMFIGALAGYVFNIIVLSKKYEFSLWENIAYTKLDFSRLAQILTGFLSVFGFSTGSVFSIATLFNFLCMCWIVFTIIAIVYAVSHRKNIPGSFYRYAVFVLCTYVVFILLYTFTDLAYVDRYCIPVNVLSIPLLAAFFSHVKFREQAKNTAIVLLATFVIICSIVHYIEWYKRDDTAEFRNITEVLEEKEYYNGYASFWNGNILTELSNGTVDVWSWGADIGENWRGIDAVSTVWHWLQLREHTILYPEGKVFVLFEREQLERLVDKEQFDTAEILYQSDKYIMFGYESDFILRNELLT